MLFLFYVFTCFHHDKLQSLPCVVHKYVFKLFFTESNLSVISTRLGNEDNAAENDVNH